MDTAIVVLFLAGLITGFSKFSVGGMGLLVLPILLVAFPGPEALAVLLPLYIITDIMAVWSYRSKVNWSVLARFLPLAFLGVFVASHFLANIDGEDFINFLGFYDHRHDRTGVISGFPSCNLYAKALGGLLHGLSWRHCYHDGKRCWAAF